VAQIYKIQSEILGPVEKKLAAQNIKISAICRNLMVIINGTQQDIFCIFVVCKINKYRQAKTALQTSIAITLAYGRLIL